MPSRDEQFGFYCRVVRTCSNVDTSKYSNSSLVRFIGTQKKSVVFRLVQRKTECIAAIITPTPLPFCAREKAETGYVCLRNHTHTMLLSGAGDGLDRMKEVSRLFGHGFQ